MTHYNEITCKGNSCISIPIQDVNGEWKIIHKKTPTNNTCNMKDYIKTWHDKWRLA